MKIDADLLDFEAIDSAAYLDGYREGIRRCLGKIRLNCEEYLHYPLYKPDEEDKLNGRIQAFEDVIKLCDDLEESLYELNLSNF